MGRLLNPPETLGDPKIPKSPEIPAYTFDELQELNLPGYKSYADAYDILSPESDWTSVLSASEYLVRPSLIAKRSLTAVRKKNPHKQVVSTPTMQMGENYRWQQTLISYRQLHHSIDQIPCNLPQDAPLTHELGLVASFTPKPEPLDERGGILTYYVDRLNRYKLGLPSRDEASATGLALGTASLCSVHIGFSRVNQHEEGEPLYEPLANVAVAVRLTPAAARLLPNENERYEHIGWTHNSDTFVEDVKNKDTLRLAPIAGSIAVWYCAYGLCLQTTSAVSSRLDLNGHLAYDKWGEFFPSERFVRYASV